MNGFLSNKTPRVWLACLVAVLLAFALIGIAAASSGGGGDDTLRGTGKA